MKSRIQIAGVPHGSNVNSLWSGDFPLMSGIPGMRFVLYDNKENLTAYSFRQVCFEINISNNEIEQVIYVSHVDKNKSLELNG
jgi:hypothetical protein